MKSGTFIKKANYYKYCESNLKLGLYGNILPLYFIVKKNVKNQ